MSKKETTSCGCCVIKYIDDKPHVLLVQPFPDRDAWGIPKGHINIDESFEDCARRETLEEAGVDAIVIHELDPVRTVYRDERKTVVSFLARQKDESQVPFLADGENVAIRYFSFDKLPDVHYYQRSLISQVRELTKQLSREVFSDQIPQEIKLACDEVMKFAGDTTDWVAVKREVLKILFPFFRRYFSTRDPKTKKHSLNEFEHKVIDYWKQSTGHSLVIQSAIVIADG